jgi:endonuclease G
VRCARLLSFASILAALTLPASSTAAGQGFEECREQFFNGFVPRINASLLARPQHRGLCFDGFAVLHSGSTKTPAYVAEHLTPQRLRDASDEVRSEHFFEDARIPQAERATLDDYRGSGYDRGHMAPAADMPNGNAMAQSFSLANVVPQAPDNNRGPWARSVESVTRKYVERGNSVYVFTGPIYGPQTRKIGRGRVWVPNELFKLVYDPERRHAWAFILPNVDGVRVNGVYSYAQLVERTGIEFLPPGAVFDPTRTK